MWMETDQLVGFVNNDSVGSWANSGNGGTGYDLLQSGSTKKPLYKTSGGPNGKPFLLFDGINDTMGTSSTSVINDSVGTIIAVFEPTAQLGTFQTFFIGRKFGLYYLMDGASHHWGVFLGSNVLSSHALTQSTFYVLGLVVRAANDVDLYFGLTKETKTTGSSYDAKGQAFLASNGDTQQYGNIGVVALGYDDSALNTTTMNDIIQGLSDKYGISV